MPYLFRQPSPRAGSAFCAAALLVALLSIAAPAQAFFSLLKDDVTVPEDAQPTVVVSLYESIAAPAACFKVFPPIQQAAMIVLLSFPQACATWPQDGTPTCTIYINPLDSDLTMGHEILHCTAHDFHSDLPI